MKKAIIGAGGFAREVQAAMGLDCILFVDDEYLTNQLGVCGLSTFNPQEYEVVVAIGDPKLRQQVVESLPDDTKYFTFVDPSAQLHDSTIEIGEGSIICAGTILTTNIKIGKHSQLNLHTTVGHDTVLGEYCTTAPGTKISGNCVVGDRVYFGTNSSVREKVFIVNDVILGLNAGVVDNIVEVGTYVGTPVKKIK